MDDDDLVAQVAAGDDAALRELFGRHAPWLAVRLRAVLPAADVEDVLQETFLAAWRGAGGYRPQGACGGWLWGIARRQAALLLRRRGPAEQAGTALPADLAGREAPDPAETALARALLTTPSLLLPWLLTSVVVLAAGAAATTGSGQPMVALLAPAVAAAAIAYSYGPGIDPAWELSCSMAVSDRMVLLVRALAVFAVNAVLGLAASAVAAAAGVPAGSGAAAAVTFGWLIPMTAVCAFALAVATVARSASGGAAAGVAAWLIIVLSGRVASGHFAAAVTDTVLFLPYLAIGAGCAAVAVYATRTPRGSLG